MNVLIVLVRTMERVWTSSMPMSVTVFLDLMEPIAKRVSKSK